MRVQEVPVYLFLGFLESGKSTFIKETLEDGQFNDGSRGLFISCEEGEVEIDDALLRANRFDTETLDEESSLTEEFLDKCNIAYRPERVFIEYNGMWNPETLFNLNLPGKWEIYQVIMMADASTFALYLGNMRSMVGNMIKYSELVIFNRCSEDQDLPMFRRNVKAVNTSIQTMFEHKDGRMIELGKDIPPYDLTADVIDISDDDYGIWYMDAADDKERYDGRTVRFRAKILKNRKFAKGFFVPGRNIMTCCANDIRFMGFLCKSNHADELKTGQWLTVTADIHYEKRREYNGEGPVLYAKHLTTAEKPDDEIVYFY